MNTTFSKNGWEDYLYWYGQDKKKLERINDLIKDIKRHPFTGIGKPEPLRGSLKGYWSRRIDSKHRLVYKTSNNTVFILQARLHYGR